MSGLLGNAYGSAVNSPNLGACAARSSKSASVPPACSQSVTSPCSGSSRKVTARARRGRRRSARSPPSRRACARPRRYLRARRRSRSPANHLLSSVAPFAGALRVAWSRPDRARRGCRRPSRPRKSTPRASAGASSSSGRRYGIGGPAGLAQLPAPVRPVILRERLLPVRGPALADLEIRGAA